MRKQGWITLLATIALVCGLVTARAAAQSNADLHERVTTILQSWETMDLAKISPYYANDPDYAFFDLVPLKYQNWAAYRAGVQKFIFDPNKSVKLTMNDDLQTHRHNDFAWATFTFQADIVSKADAVEHLEGRWTMVLAKRDGKWIVVHEHVSVPMGGGS